MSAVIRAVFESVDLADIASGRLKRTVNGIRNIRIKENRYSVERHLSHDQVDTIIPAFPQNISSSQGALPVILPDSIFHDGRTEVSERKDALLEAETEDYSAETTARLLRSVGGTQIRISKK